MEKMIEHHFKSNYDAMKRRIQRYFNSPHDAEDALQRAYENALIYHYAFEGEYEGFDNWFYGILRNTMIETRKFYGKSFTLARQEEPRTKANEAEDMLFCEQIKKKIDEEHPRHHTLLKCHFIFGLSPREIASLTEHKQYAVAKAILRFKDKITTKEAGNIRRGYANVPHPSSG